MYLYKLTWSGKTATISQAQTIPLSRTYVSPNGGSLQNRAVQPAPGDKLHRREARRTTCVYAHGNSIFSCNSAKNTVTSRCGVFWCEVRASNGALMQEGFVDSPDHDYLAASLAVDANGNIGLGCTQTSATEFPSVCVMMHGAHDPKNTMRAVAWPPEEQRSFRAIVPASMGWHGEITIRHVSIRRTRQSFGLTRSTLPAVFLRNTPPAGLPSGSGDPTASLSFPRSLIKHGLFVQRSEDLNTESVLQASGDAIPTCRAHSRQPEIAAPIQDRRLPIVASDVARIDFAFQPRG